ncbi:MAG TPA: ribonuclease H-like domain-containing protein [Planctomycetota bacterium]|nr:ribonuclease H-like domain-containing protein [Planctomycetota bacterium]
MLERTFIHIPGVGPKREKTFWNDGVLCWEDMLKDRDLFDEGPPPPLEQEITLSRRKLAEADARWFEQRLGPSESWRMAADFDDGRTAYLDIETDGGDSTAWREGQDAPGGTTVVAVWDGIEARVFLRDRDLHLIPEYLAKYKVLCTFNGKAFDIPYLEGRFGKDFFNGAHLDLRPITTAVGLKGGLKKIEKQIGIERPASIRRYTGYDAVKLWGAYRRGRKDALEPLARYNLADAVNLQSLMRVAYNWAVAHDELPFRRFDSITSDHINEATEKCIKELMSTVTR